MEREPIKDFYGKVLGWIETDTIGNRLAKDFYGKVIGKYEKSTNTTKDFYGRVIARGDVTSGLIYSNANKK